MENQTEPNHQPPNGRNFITSIPYRSSGLPDTSSWKVIIDYYEQAFMGTVAVDDNDARHLQMLSIERLCRTFRLLLYTTPPDAQTISLIHDIFLSIGELATWTGLCGVFQANDHVQKQVPVINSYMKTLADDLESIRSTFNQKPDPTQQKLFQAALHIVEQKRAESTQKHPYPWGTALTDANRQGRYYSERDFDARYETLKANFAMWRYRRRKRSGRK